MELVLLVVAADEGVMPQTREHVAACELLGIRRAVIAVTKLDRVGEEVARLAGEEALELCEPRFRCDLAICSARTGEGIEAVREAVRSALRELAPPAASGRARLSVDRVFSVKGSGTVVTGTLVEGRLALGTPLRVVGETGALETAARGLHVHDAPVDVAEAPTRLALNLAGAALESVHRGDVVTDDRTIVPTRMIDVELRGARVKSGQNASLYVGTARTTVRVDPVSGEVDLARLRLERPLPVVGGDRFVLRGSDVEGPAGAVIGGGLVLDARPPRARPRAKRRAVLEALRASDATRTAAALVDEAAPRPVPADSLGARFPLPAPALIAAAEALVKRGDLSRTKGGAWALKSTVVDLSRLAQRLVAEHHRAAPLDRGIPLETLRRRLAAVAGADVAEDAIKLAAAPKGAKQGEPIVVEGDVARMASFAGAPTSGAAANALEAATRAIAQAALRGVTEFALREAAACSPKEAKAVLAKLVRDNVAIHAGDLWFSRAAVDDLRARVVAHLAQQPRLTIADFKALSGLGRKQAIPLLEQLDREGVTRREGDDRVRVG
jgi:selenocysteine-specific elongation factor